MKRRLLAMVLSLAMLMGLLPTAALAAGSGGPSGGAPYQDLGQREEGAVSAAKFTIYKDGVKAAPQRKCVGRSVERNRARSDREKPLLRSRRGEREARV